MGLFDKDKPDHHMIKWQHYQATNEVPRSELPPRPIGAVAMRAMAISVLFLVAAHFAANAAAIALGYNAGLAVSLLFSFGGIFWPVIDSAIIGLKKYEAALDHPILVLIAGFASWIISIPFIFAVALAHLTLDKHPILVGLANNIGWIIFFSYYLSLRSRCVNGELQLKKKYRKEASESHTEEHPTKPIQDQHTFPNQLGEPEQATNLEDMAQAPIKLSGRTAIDDKKLCYLCGKQMKEDEIQSRVCRDCRD